MRCRSSSPLLCSISTRCACLGYVLGVSCSESPLNLSSLVSGVASSLPDAVPSRIEDALRGRVNELQPIADRFGTVLVYFRWLLAIGGVFIVILFVLFVYFAFLLLSSVTNVLSRLSGPCRIALLSGLGKLCCSPLALLAALFAAVQAKTKTLPHWIEAQSGRVSGLCFGALECAVVMAMLTVVTPIVMDHYSRAPNANTVKAARSLAARKVRWAGKEIWLSS